MIEITRPQVTEYSIDEHTLLIYHGSRLIAIGNDIIRLTPIEYKLILSMLGKRVVSDTELAQIQYPTIAINATAGIKQSIERHIVNLRSKLRAYGLNIYRIQGYGYILANYSQCHLT